MSPAEHKLAIIDKDGKAVAIHQSIYPSREVIEVFETYHKGAAQEILQMSRDEQRHAHRMESAGVRFRFMGTAFGFVLCLTMLLIGAFLVYVDKPVSGCTTMIVAFLTLVGNFFASPQKQKE